MKRDQLPQGVHPALQPIKEKKPKCYGRFYQAFPNIPNISTCILCEYYIQCKIASINKQLEIRKKALK